MALFDKLRKKENSSRKSSGKSSIESVIVDNYSKDTVYSPLEGEIVPLNQVSDGAFASGAMGPGIAIDPTNGILYSPVRGKVTALFPTNHALGIIGENGAEILIHIGIDTVEMNGEGFEALIENGADVDEGQPLIKFDLKKIKERGLEAVTMIIISNMFNFKDIEITDESSAQPAQALLRLS